MKLLGNYYKALIFWFYRQIADSCHKGTGYRYYVIRESEYRYRIICSVDIAEHNRINSKKNKIDINRLLTGACYVTKSSL